MTGIIRGQSPWVPEGVYTVKYCGYDTGKSWNACKVTVHFAIVEGEFAGISLDRFYNANALVRPFGANGIFEVTDRGALVREYRSLFPGQANKSELDLNAYGNKLIRARVGTSNRNGLGKELSPVSRYSVIRELIEIIPDDYEVLFNESSN